MGALVPVGLGALVLEKRFFLETSTTSDSRRSKRERENE